MRRQARNFGLPENRRSVVAETANRAGTARGHEGSWQRLRNLAEDAPELARQLAGLGAGESFVTVHDSDTGKEMGYSRAIVGTDVILHAFMPALHAVYGASFYEGGWLEYRDRAPVYGGDEVRVTAATEDDGALALRLEDRDLNRCAEGRAGLARPDGRGASAGRVGSSAGAELLRRKPLGATAPPRDENDPGVLPELPAGTLVTQSELSPGAGLIAAFLDACGRDPLFGTASPWGPPVVPPTMALYRIISDFGAPLDEMLGEGSSGRMVVSGVSLRSHRPVLQGSTYTNTGTIGAKGRGRRFPYFMFEVAVDDPSGGRCLEVGMRVTYVPPESGIADE